MSMEEHFFGLSPCHIVFIRILMKVCHLLNPPDSPKPVSHIPPAAPALHRRRKKPWTIEDTRLLQEMRADGDSWQRIAGSLHRNVTAAACRMHFLRLQPHTQTPASNLRRWSPEETNRLEVLVHNSVPYSIIAQRLDRTIDACSKKYNKMQPKKLRRGATTSVPLPRLAPSLVVDTADKFSPHRVSRLVGRDVITIPQNY
jgi:hypothetical protein